VEFAKYGVLVPPLEVKYKRAYEPLDRKEIMLFEAIKVLLENEELRNKYASLGFERARDFDIEKIAKEWMALLKEL
jgi:glycosyltransferase involved in cell wall biosynthesis